MRTWEREGYKVIERPFDFDLHHFDVVTDNGYLVGTLCPATIADMQNIVADLDAGEDVNGWEDGMGGTIYVPTGNEGASETAKYEVDGIEYTFSDDSVDGEPVIVARYVENGEGFAIWTRDVVSLPESAEEAKEYMEKVEWAVEQSSALDSNREKESR